MKKNATVRNALIGGIGFLILCGIFAWLVPLLASHPEPQTTPTLQKNSLEEAENGTSLLLRATDDGDEYFAANYFPTLSGAKGDGLNNDTKALQNCLEEAGKAGGTVYLPQGIYRIDKPLTVPLGVTLRGDFSAPDAKSPHGAKTILLVADTKETRSASFLTLENGASAIGITVYYEAQRPDKIIEYPATISCTGACDLEKITLLNPYRGICFAGTGAVRADGIWISPLDYGILVAENNASVVLEDCSVSPTYWLNYAPSVFADGKEYSVLTEYLHREMQAVVLERVTDISLCRIFAENAAMGLYCDVPQDRDCVLLIKELNVSTTKQPVYLQSLPKAGICFADCTLRPDNNAGSNTVEIAKGITAPAVFSGCIFGGQPKTVIKADNNAFLSFYHCNFGTWWDACFAMESDTFMAISPVFKSGNNKATLGQNAFGLLYNGPEMEESSQLLFSVTEENAKETLSENVSALKGVQTPVVNAPVINAARFGVSPDSPDNTGALTAVLAAAEQINAIVFLPEGTYRFTSTVTIPEKVRFVGAGNKGPYATVLSFDLRENTSASLVELKHGASLEHLEVRQSSGLADSVNTYAVSSLYSDIRLHNLTVTAGRGIWLTGGQNHILEHITANVTQTGLFLQDLTNTTGWDITVTDPSGSYGTVGIRIESTSITLSEVRGVNLAYGIDMVGNCDVKGTLVTLRGPSVGISADHSGSALFTAIGSSELGENGETIFLKGTENQVGSVTLQGVISTGPAVRGHFAEVHNGTVTLRAALITNNFPTTVACYGGNVGVYGCVWTEKPTFHAQASGGEVVLAGNLIQSDRVFEGLESSYLLTAVAENGGKITDGVNMIKHTYVYVDTEDSDTNLPAPPEES